MDRRSFVAGALALGLSPAQAEPAYKRLIPLLIDLPGFEGRKADGRTVPTGEGTLTTASRFYEKGAASYNVTVVIGVTAPSPAEAAASGPVTTEEVDGFKLMKDYDAAESSGALLIVLDETAILEIDYRQLSQDDAVALARKLDWKALAAAAK